MSKQSNNEHYVFEEDQDRGYLEEHWHELGKAATVCALFYKECPIKGAMERIRQALHIAGLGHCINQSLTPEISIVIQGQMATFRPLQNVATDINGRTFRVNHAGDGFEEFKEYSLYIEDAMPF